MGGLGVCSVVGHMLSLDSALNLIPNTAKQGHWERHSTSDRPNAQCTARRHRPSLPSRPWSSRLTLLVAVDADDLTEGHHEGIVPVHTEKEL